MIVISADQIDFEDLQDKIRQYHVTEEWQEAKRLMNPRIIDVKPADDYNLRLLFDNNEERVFDVKPYLDKGVFRQLKDRRIFNSVRPFLGSIQWVNGLDFCPDTLYLESKGQESSSNPLQLPRSSH
jgi:hypothetical protein